MSVYVVQTLRGFEIPEVVNGGGCDGAALRESSNANAGNKKGRQPHHNKQSHKKNQNKKRGEWL
jgi:hypothetical protein